MVYFCAYACSEIFQKKCQGINIRGGSHAILCRHQWAEKRKKPKTPKNPAIPNFCRVNFASSQGM